MDEYTFSFKDEFGCFNRLYAEVFGTNPDNEQDFAKIYEEHYETAEVL